MRLVSHISPCRTTCNPRVVHVTLLVNKTRDWGRRISDNFSFPPPAMFPPMFNTHYKSFGKGSQFRTSYIRIFVHISEFSYIISQNCCTSYLRIFVHHISKFSYIISQNCCISYLRIFVHISEFSYTISQNFRTSYLRTVVHHISELSYIISQNFRTSHLRIFWHNLTKTTAVFTVCIYKYFYNKKF
jgi:hypothetical protein